MPEKHPHEAQTRTKKSSPTGSCGGPGLCPGIALFIAMIVGSGITMLTGLEWVGGAVGIPLALILITGAWRWIPTKKHP